MEKITYYSPEDIANNFNIKADTVRKWIRDGKLKAVKLGRMWRVSENSLQEFIKTNKN